MASMRINVESSANSVNPTVPSCTDPLSQLFQAVTQIAKEIEQDRQKQPSNRLAPTGSGTTQQNNPNAQYGVPFESQRVIVREDRETVGKHHDCDPAIQLGMKSIRQRTSEDEKGVLVGRNVAIDQNAHFGMQMIRELIVGKEEPAAVNRHVLADIS